MSHESPLRHGYVGLFGDFGNALSDNDWMARANSSLPPNLSALNTEFIGGCRTEKTLQVRYEPGPASFSFFSLSGGATAEMLDQAATHCATFVTGYGCPTLTMTTNYFRPGKGSLFVANARVVSVTSASAIVAAELVDARDEPIAAASVVAQFIKDITRYA
jgi:acyl-coenzyme A thioesterase PaaI-like protein